MTDHLIVIDMQPGFGHPESPWCTPGYARVADNIAQLLPVFQDRVLFTRFLPPLTPTGAWVPYYEAWPFALDPEQRWLWELDARFTGGTVQSHRFAKWREAAPLVPEDATLVIAGVATDCCVLGTAIEAVDDGRRVRLVADACSAGSEALHEAALTVMRDRAPMLTITDTATEAG